MENKSALSNPSRFRTLFAKLWNPTPPQQPTVNRELARLPAAQRIAEVFRYTVLCFEFWVSPGGGLREWARFNCAAALFIGLPALIVVPIITLLLNQLTSWTIYLVQIAGNFVLFPVMMLAVVAIVTALLCFIRGLLRR